jgi:lipopolysaccharide transport system permease protein
VTLASSLFHAMVSCAVLLAFVVAIEGGLHPTVVLFPLAVVPVVFLSLGASWLLASIGVFFRDATHTVTLLVTVLMFASPVFYPLSAIPGDLRWIFALNPLAQSIADARSVVLQGAIPDLRTYAIFLVASAAFAWAGLAWFMRTKHAFADVL